MRPDDCEVGLNKTEAGLVSQGNRKQRHWCRLVPYVILLVACIPLMAACFGAFSEQHGDIYIHVGTDDDRFRLSLSLSHRLLLMVSLAGISSIVLGLLFRKRTRQYLYAQRPKYCCSDALQSPYMTTTALALIRLFFGLLIGVALCCNLHLMHQADRLSQFVFYLTNLAGTSTAVYHLLSACLGFASYRAASMAVETLHHHLYSTNFVLQPIITVVFWGLLRGYQHIHSARDLFIQLSLHGFPAFTLFFDFCVTRKSYLSRRDWIVVVLCLVLYQVWMVMGSLMHAEHGPGGKPWMPYRIFKGGMVNVLVSTLLILGIALLMSLVSYWLHQWKATWPTVVIAVK